MRKAIYKFLIGSALVLLCADNVRAEIEGIQLQVDGLSCPFCAIGIHKQLKQTGDLEEIEVHLKQGVTEAKFLVILSKDRIKHLKTKLNIAVTSNGKVLDIISTSFLGKVDKK